MAVCCTVGVALALLFYWVVGGHFASGSLHKPLLYVGIYLAVMPALQISVGFFCEERRNQTLELLYLTGMGAGELFLGKLLGGILIASSDLLALAPFVAVPFMMGGLSRDLFLATVACFPILLLFTVAVGTLTSVCTEEDGAALAWAAGLMALLSLAIPLPYYFGHLINGKAPFSARWLCLSPAFGPYLVGTNFAGHRPALFWLNGIITLGLATAALILAAIILNRNWRQRIVMRSTATGWRGRWQNWIHGSAEWRVALRRKLLPQNPFQWLAQQDRQPVAWVWTFIAFIVVIWLLGWLAWPQKWPSPMNLYVTAALLVIGTDLIVTYAAARRIGMDRRDGALELLLTSPLSPQEIVDGQLAALDRQFRPMRWVLAVLCAIMMWGGFFTRVWITPAVVSYLVIWCFFFGWIFYKRYGVYSMAMWVALNTGRTIFAIMRFRRANWSWARHWYWIYWMWNLPSLWSGLSHAGQFPSGSVVEVVFVCFLGLIAFLMAAGSQYTTPPIRERLLKEMRSIAREPVPEVNDPRYKNWDVNQRFPPKLPIDPLAVAMSK